MGGCFICVCFYKVELSYLYPSLIFKNSFRFTLTLREKYRGFQNPPRSYTRTVPPLSTYLRILHSVALDKCVMTHMHHDSVVQNYFTALEVLCVLALHSCLRFEPLTTTHLFTGPIILPFPEGQMKVKVKVSRLCLTVCDPMDYTGHGFSRPEYWSGQPFPSPGDLANPGIEPRSPALQADSLPVEPPGKHEGPIVGIIIMRLLSLSDMHSRFLDVFSWCDSALFFFFFFFPKLLNYNLLSAGTTVF